MRHVVDCRNGRYRKFVALCFLAVSTFLSACFDASVAPHSQVADGARSHDANFSQQAKDERTAAVQGRQSRGIEDEILRLEEVLPGLGGLFLDSAGTLVVYGPPDSSVVSVKGLIAQQAAALNIRDVFRQRLSSGDRVEVLPSRFAFSHLVVWQQALASQSGPGDGIIALDANEAANRVTVSVRDANAASSVSALAQSIGVPSEAVQVRLEDYPVQLATLRDKVRPTGAGLQIVNKDNGKCTLGFNATTTTGITGFITASHCAPGTPGLGHTGSLMYQNVKTLYSTFLGNIVNNPLFNYTNLACGAYTRCTAADVMLVEYAGGISNQKRMIQTSSVGISNAPGSITISSSWLINGRELYPLVGESIDKMGRSTGWTRGTIANTCETIVVDSTTPSAYRRVCAIRVDGASVGQGDSGGPVFNYQNGYMYGSLFAGKPLNAYDSDGFHYCSANCSYYFSGFQAMTVALGYTPIPY